MIDQAARLDLDQMRLLARARHPAAAEAYSRAWEDWLGQQGTAEQYKDEDFEGTLAMPTRKSGSPIHHGFLVLHGTISNRAKQLVGPTAFVVDEDGEQYLEPTWSLAAKALLETAMAVGTTFVSEEDRRIMSTAWHSVFGSPPQSSASK